MIDDKFNVAQKHALIVRAIGASNENDIETRELVGTTVENCLSLLQRYGCHDIEARSLIADALENQLVLVSGPPAYARCRTALNAALELVGF